MIAERQVLAVPHFELTVARRRTAERAPCLALPGLHTQITCKNEKKKKKTMLDQRHFVVTGQTSKIITSTDNVNAAHISM